MPLVTGEFHDVNQLELTLTFRFRLEQWKSVRDQLSSSGAWFGAVGDLRDGIMQAVNAAETQIRVRTKDRE